MSIKKLVTSLLVVASGTAIAQDQPSPSDVIIMHSAKVETPSDAFATIDRLNSMPEITPFDGEDTDTADVIIEKFVNLGKKVWAVIQANQPVANARFSFANALPQGVTSSSDLENFSGIQSSSVRLWGTNLAGMTVYDVTLTAVHQYGGSYDGKGKYLETVSIIPSNLSVLWGYSVDYAVDGIATTNAGTKANPVAQMTLNAKFKVSSVLQKSERNTVYEFRGDSPTVRTSGF